MKLEQFIEQKKQELEATGLYRTVVCSSYVEVTMNDRCLSEKFTAGNTPMDKEGHEVERDGFPVLESPLVLNENGTHVVFNVTPVGKRNPEQKGFYFLWDDEIDMNALIKDIEQWSINKGLDQAESSKQFLKIIEEVGEVASALAKKKPDELKDGIGDVIVTFIILAQQQGLTIQECTRAAYEEIAGRTGKMVDGVFIKSSDLFNECKEENRPDTIEFGIAGKEII